MMRSLTIALLLVAAPAAAQQDFSKVEIKPQTLSPGVHVLFGQGGNIGVSTGPDGTLLIDDQFAPLTPKVQAAVATLSPIPVRFVINTHWHGDHTGGNENLGKAGAVIVAHDNVRTRMSTEQVNAFFKSTTPPSPAAALPVVTFADSVTFHVNGETIRAVHLAPAHTDGDSLVRFDRANVIHMGDLFTAIYPFIDLSSGGSARGFVAAHDAALKLGNASTKYIRGHGPVGDRAALTAYRDMIADVIGRVRLGIAKKQGVDAIVAAKPTAPYDALYGGGFIKPDVFVRTVYASLTAEAAKAARR